MNKINIKEQAHEVICDMQNQSYRLKEWFESHQDMFALTALDAADNMLSIVDSRNKTLLDSEPDEPVIEFRGDVPVCEAWLNWHMGEPEVYRGSNKFHLFGEGEYSGIYVCLWNKDYHGRDVDLYFNGGNAENHPTRNRIIALGEQLKYPFKNVPKDDPLYRS